ncbi:MAG TPA: PHB depolymerase family esterase [Candidatus Dormibacteraeota bacterium]|jgi:poly(hydroxyalkanoate) depolymerase family esterase
MTRLARLAVALTGLLAVVASPLTTVTAGAVALSAGSPNSGNCTAQRPTNWPTGDGEQGAVFQCKYSQDGLTRTSWVYQPMSWNSLKPAPVVVVLHGCTEQGPDIAYISRFDVEAERRGMIVVYPNQADFTSTGTTTFDGNGSHCWNWFLPQGQARGAGEPALIAGLTREAVAQWHGDQARTFVIGISAGGATSDIMAATYPDIFAATAILAGCEYRGLPCLAAPAALPPLVSAQLTYQASGGHARVVPFMVENGDVDPVVPVANALEITQQWQYADDYAAHHGTLSSPVVSAPCAQQVVVPSSPVDTSQSPPAVRNPYDVYYFSASGAACPQATSSPAAALGELWIVHGEFHAWPGGPALTTPEPYTNPGGPNFTRAATDFFLAHPCRVLRGVCAPAA